MSDCHFLLCAVITCALVTTATASVPPDDVFAYYTMAESLLPNAVLGERRFAQDPCDDYSDRKAFDFIVVGAGAAGCVLANRLTEVAGWRVLLLEAGGDETSGMGIPFVSGASSAVDWNYTSAAQADGGCPLGPEGNCPYPRGFVMGGSTTVNGMAFTRGNRRDYDNWAALGNEGWDYDSVLPYFKKMENVQIPELRDSPYHGTEGNIMNSRPYETIFTNYTLEAALSLGIPEVDFNGANQSGISRMQSTTFQGSRWSANRGYISGLRRRNLFVRKHSLVSKVIIRNGRAVGVEYIRDGEPQKAFATKEVILSAGAINTPQLLMLSGVGPQEHLQELGIPVVQDLPVGLTLFDHTIFAALIITLNSSITPTRLETVTNMLNWAEYFANYTGPLTTLAGGEVLGFFEVGDEAVNDNWPNFELFASAYPNVINPLTASVLGIPDDFYQQFSFPLLNLPAIQSYVLTLRPKSYGTLTLQDTNIYSQPIIDPNYYAEEEDVLQAVEAIKYVIDIFTSGPFADLGAQVYDTPIPRCANFTFGTDDYWSCAVRWGSATVYHPSCTAKMGPRNDTTAVVSPDLKVRNIAGLRVVDASVIPVIPAAHTMVPTYMIAEKASDLIKCEHINRRYCRFVAA